MKKYIIAGFIILCLVGCTLYGTPTPTQGVTPTPTQDIATLVSPTATNTPDATVTPFILPSATATSVPTETIVPTQVVGCTTIPCGLNLFFNGGFEVLNSGSQEGDRYDDRTPGGNYDILTAPFWNFEFLTGTSKRNPAGTLTAPEAGERLGQFYDYRVDGYTPNVNERAQVWFRPSAWVDAGVTQSVLLEEGQRYAIGASVSTWSAPGWEPTHERSRLETEDDKSNIQWSIRANYSNGKVYDGRVLETFDYNDGIYDFSLGADGKNHFNGKLLTYFVAPTDSDADNYIQVNLGFTANNMWNLEITDYHIDNAFLYCMTCSYEVQPTPDFNATPTQIVDVEEPTVPTFVTVVADSLLVRPGASRDFSPIKNTDGTNKTVLAGQKYTVYAMFIVKATGERWARINPMTEPVGQWIAVIHDVCVPDRICSIITQ